MTDYAELCERLRDLDSGLGHAVWDRGCQSCALASNTISQAVAAIERLSAALERIAGGFPEVRAPHRVTAMRDLARTTLKGADQ